MNINGNTRLLGVIGNPVEHTMSPVIHNNLADILGDNFAYAPFRVENENVGDAVRGAYALNMLGMNVTVPHKSAVIPFLKEIDPLAERIGAVNTLVRCEGGFKGYNTDMPGLLRAMKYDGVDFAGEDVIILGAGGVARAVAMMLLENGAGHIYILNRSVEKAKAIADELNGLHNSVSYHDLQSYVNLPDKKYIVIQATSVGMLPNTEEVVIEDEKFYDMVSVGYDIVFNPLETKFMKLCKRAGAEAFGGLRMLLYQGIIAYELWKSSMACPGEGASSVTVGDDTAERIYDMMISAMQANR